MALSPSSINRSVMVLDSRGNKILQSTTFIASFSGSVVKYLNSKSWVDKRLFTDSDLVEVRLSVNECTLYHRDWSNNPTFGTFKENYPPCLS